MKIIMSRYSSIALAFVLVVVARIIQSHALAYFVIGLLSLYILVINYRYIRIDIVSIAAILLAVACSCVTLLSPNLSVEDAIKPLIWFLLFYAFYTLAVGDGEAYIRNGLNQIAFFIVIATVFGFIFQYLFGLRFASDSIINNFRIYAPFQTVSIADPLALRMRSVFSHPIVFADLACFAFLVLLYLGKRNTRLLFSLILLILAIYATKTRSAWLSFLAVVVIIGIIYALKDRVSWRIIALLPVPIGLCCLVLLVNGVLESIVDRFLELSTDVSFTQRSGAIAYMLELYANDPLAWLFGHGFGASKQAMLGITIDISNFDTVDNQWVAGLYDFGIIPMAAILFLSVAVFVKAVRSSDNVQWALSMGGVLLSVFDMCFYDMFLWDAMVFVWFMSLGYLSGSSFGKKLKSRPQVIKVAETDLL